MDIKKLFSGVGVIIDDKIKSKEDDEITAEEDDLIIKIKDKLIENDIPILEFEDLPNNQTLKNLKNISFILLDWELFDSRLGDSAKAEEFKRIFTFIKQLKEDIFVPLFIFSNEAPDFIIKQLSENNLYYEGKTNYIFVKSKSDLFDSENFCFFDLISQWIETIPSIYVLKEWENSLTTSKNKLFWDFYNIDHEWPSILKETFTKDGSDVNYELGNFIFKNIMARTQPIEFDENILKLQETITKDAIRKVLEAERFLESASLPPEIPFTGDLYEIYKYELDENTTSEKKLYYLNIRPDCDIAIRGENINPKLYCLECKVIKEKRINSSKSDQIIFYRGSFIEKRNNIFLPFVNDGKILTINFKDLAIFEWNEELLPKNNNGAKRIFKKTRIGRVLPPYITAIQQKYSFYLQRQGLPAIPQEAING